MADEWGYSLLRSYALVDIAVRSGGDGRTVEAYAAMYDAPYEVRDQHGHYMEVIERSAFNRTLSGAGKNAVCLYNHGLDLTGRPDSMAQIPLGRTLEIRSDSKGLVTRTRYNDGAYADSILEAIRNGAIKSQSFRGAIYRSSPNRVPKVRDGEALPTVTRHELGLRDYGPTPVAMNPAEMILAVRSAAAAAEILAALPQDERTELARMLSAATPEQVPADASATDIPSPGAEDPHTVHSGRLAIARARMRMELISRGLHDNG